MPALFTCRLTAVRTPSGRYRIEYGPLPPAPRDDAWVLTLTGPAVAVPPPGEVADPWEWAAAEWGPRGFRVNVTADPPPGSALVEASRPGDPIPDPHDPIPEGGVVPALWWAPTASGGQTFAVRLYNGSGRTIHCLTAVAEQAHDAPCPWGQDTAGGITLDPVRPLPEVFTPGESVNLVLDPRRLNDFQNRAAVLPVEGHWISLRSRGREFDRIRGGLIAWFLANDDE
jgi:hypothetical protein